MIYMAQRKRFRALTIMLMCVKHVLSMLLNGHGRGLAHMCVLRRELVIL